MICSPKIVLKIMAVAIVMLANAMTIDFHAGRRLTVGHFQKRYSAKNLTKTHKDIGRNLPPDGNILGGYQQASS